MPDTVTVVCLDNNAGVPLPNRQLTLQAPMNAPHLFVTGASGQDSFVPASPGPLGRLLLGTTPADDVPRIAWRVLVYGQFSSGGLGSKVMQCPTTGEVVVEFRIPPAPILPPDPEPVVKSISPDLTEAA